MSPVYTFEHVERDCPYNKDLRARGGNTRDLIRDYKVLRDGEHVATFSRNFRGSKWELYDRIGRPIIKPARTYHHHRGEECRSKAEFPRLIADVEALIPTAEQCREWEASERKRELRERRAAFESARLDHIRSRGPQLLEALRDVGRAKAVPLGLVAAAARETVDKIEDEACAKGESARKAYIFQRRRA